MTSHFLQLAFVLAAMSGIAAVLRPGHAQAGPGCLVRSEPSRRLELADGRIVSVDVKSVAQSAGSVMAAGDLGYVFPRDASDRTSPSMQDSILGVVIDRQGRVTLVGNPLLPQKVHHPRVAPGPGGSFHVIFTASRDTAVPFPGPADTVDIWYGRYGAGRWSALRRVRRMAGVWMSQDHAHELLARDGALTFAAPFGDERSVASRGGIVVFRSSSGGTSWRVDTLRTGSVPSAVRIALAERRVQVLYARVAVGDELWLAGLDTGWTGQRRIAGDGRRGIRFPAMAITRRGTVVSWNSQVLFNDASARLEWMVLDRDGRISTRPTIDSGSASAYPRLIVLDDEVPAWMYHARQFDAGLSIVTAVGDVLERHADVVAPFSNPVAAVATLADRRLLVFTMKAARTSAEPMVASYTTAVEIRCPSPG